MRRRRLLGTLGLTTLLAGCASLNPFECDPSREATITAEPITLAADQRSSIDPIAFNELPPEEQRLVRTAINEDAYRKCPAADPSIPDALTSFANRAANHSDEEGKTDLRYDGEYYELQVDIEDQQYAG